jgi:xylulokinase
MGIGFYADSKEAFSSLEKIAVIEPETEKREPYLEAYSRWKQHLNEII